MLRNSTILTTSRRAKNQTGMKANLKVLVAEGDQEGGKNNRGIQLPPDAITCAPAQHLFYLSTRDSKGHPPLTEDDNGPVQLWWP